MVYFFVGGGICGSLITAYVMHRLSKHRRTSQPSPRCARLSSYEEELQLPYAVHMRRVVLFTSPFLTEQEERNLTFLRHLIASGRISEEL